MSICFRSLTRVNDNRDRSKTMEPNFTGQSCIGLDVLQWNGIILHGFNQCMYTQLQLMINEYSRRNLFGCLFSLSTQNATSRTEESAYVLDLLIQREVKGKSTIFWIF